MKAKVLIPMLVIALALFSPVLLKAQTPTPPDPVDVPADVPVDGGLSLLLVAGVGYGVKKMNDKKKQAAENKNALEG